MLQSIPYGETRSYQQMALDVGLTGSAGRAVGNACASNPVASRHPLSSCGAERTALSEATGGASIVKRPLLRWRDRKSFR